MPCLRIPASENFTNFLIPTLRFYNEAVYINRVTPLEIVHRIHSLESLNLSVIGGTA